MRFSGYNFILQAKDYRFRPVGFITYDDAIKYGEARKSYRNEFNVYKFDDKTGDKELVFCSYEQIKELEKSLKEKKDKYNQKFFYSALSKVFTEEEINKHFPKLWPKANFIYFRELTKEVLEKLTTNKIKEHFISHGKKITDTTYKCYIKSENRIRSSKEKILTINHL